MSAPLLTVRHYTVAATAPAEVHTYVVGLRSPRLLRVVSP